MGLTFDVQVERVREGRPLLVGGDAVVGAGGVAAEVLREKKRKSLVIYLRQIGVCVCLSKAWLTCKTRLWLFMMTPALMSCLRSWP